MSVIFLDSDSFEMVCMSDITPFSPKDQTELSNDNFLVFLCNTIPRERCSTRALGSMSIFKQN